MGTNIGPLLVVPGVPQKIQLINLGSLQALKVTNGTPFDLNIDGFGVQGNEVIPAGLEYMLYAAVHNIGVINILPANNNGVTGNGVVNLVAYGVNETLPPGHWPATVPTQTVSANVTTTNQLINTNSVPGTTIIQVQPTDAVSPTFLLDNSGNLTIKGDNGGVLTQLLQLIAGASPSVVIAAAGILTTIAGGLVMNQGFTVDGSIAHIKDGVNIDTAGTFACAQPAQFTNGLTISNGSFTVNPASTFNANVSLGSHQIDATDYVLNGSGSYHFASNSVSRVKWGTVTPGGLSGTITHGMGAAPSFAPIMVCSQNGSTSTASTSNFGGGTTFDYNVFTSGIQYTWFAWRA